MCRYWRILMIVAVAWLALAGPVTAQDEEPGDAAEKVQADPTGSWKWQRTFGDTTMHFTLRLKRQDDQLTGTLTTKRGEEELDPAEIKDAKLEGNKLSFAIVRQFNDREFTIAYAGTVSENAIEGTTELGAGDNSREFDWQARRGFDWADVLGDWQLTFEMPNGNTFESTLTLAKEREKVTGTITSERFDERELHDIAIQEGQLAFAVIGERDGNEFRVNYKIEPRGDALKGRVHFGEDESRGFDFTGKRTPPAQEE